MRRARASRALVAALLVAAMVVSITGLLGSPNATVKITSPRPGARVSGMLDIRASVTSGVPLSYVILGIDDQRPQSSNSAPFAFEVDTCALTDGPHRIFVEAYDRYGLVGTSSAITVYVKNGAASTARAEAPSKTKVAVASAAPSRAAAATDSGGPRVESAAATAGAAVASSVAPGRGPAPTPARSAADSVLAAADHGEPAASGARAVASAPLGSPPPQPAAPRVRGHTVVVNGRPIEFDVTPYIVDGRMQAGFRALFESTGARVSWLAETRTARSLQPGLVVEVPIGRPVARVNGRSLEMDTAATIREGRTIVPVRFFADARGAVVRWDGSTRTASIEGRSRAIAGSFPGS